MTGVVVNSEEEFGARLREAIRERLGPKKEREFARRIGMDPTQLSRTLNGTVGKRPENETLQRFADGLGLPLRTVVDWTLPREARDEAPRQLALLSLTGEEEYDADALVAYVESRPGRIFQQQLAEARRERTYGEYVEFCLSIFRAWESNSNLGLKALALGRGTGTGGL